MNSAIKKEINKDYVEAIELYEKEIATSASLESYINLAFLYWSIAFELFEFNIPNNLSENLSITAGNRYPKILELGLDNYPNSVELNFWQKYFSHISFGEEFSESECIRLIEKHRDDESIVPCFYLYLFDKKKFDAERNKLLDECNKQPTAKNIYIRSILESR